MVKDERVAAAASVSISNSWMVERFRRLRPRPKAAESGRPIVLAIEGVKEPPEVQEVQAGVLKLPLALPFTVGDMTYLGGCSMNFLNGAEAQDAAVSEIQRSSAEAVIRLMAYTFDYAPLVAALCTAKASTPGRRIEVVIDKMNTLSGPTKHQYAMAR